MDLVLFLGCIIIILLSNAASALITRYFSRVQNLEREAVTVQQHAVMAASNAAESAARLAASQSQRLLDLMSGAQFRGAWGEFNLVSLLEAAGLQENVHFAVQKAVDGGALRPDVTLVLPGNTALVIDSKVPMSAYLKALEIANAPSRETELRRHAAAVKQHVTELAHKEYWKYMGPGAPQFTVMFLPSAGLLESALEADSGLLSHCINNRVVPVAGIGVLSVAWTVRAMWHPAESVEAVAQVQASADETVSRLREGIEAFREAMLRMEQVNTAYRKVGYHHKRLLKSAEKLAGLAGRDFVVKPLPEWQGDEDAK